jgi:hypothetical protein
LPYCAVQTGVALSRKFAVSTVSGGALLISDLYPVTIHGQRAWTLKEAAYLIRQYAIDHDDLWGWKLTHILRSAESPSDIERAEDALRIWIQIKQAQQRQDNRRIPAEFTGTSAAFGLTNST